MSSREVSFEIEMSLEKDLEKVVVVSNAMMEYNAIIVGKVANSIFHHNHDPFLNAFITPKSNNH